MATRDEVSTLEADVMATEVEDQELEDTAPVEGADPAPPDDAPETPAESVAATEETEAQAQADPEAPPAWTPPPDGQPLALRADGKDIPIEGALRYEHGVYIPTEALPQLQRHLADREGLNTRYTQLQQQYEARDPDKHIDVLRSRAMMQNLLAIMQQGPEKVAEWLDDFQRNAPLFQMRAENDALAKQLEMQQGQHTQLSQQQAKAELDAAMPGHFRETIEAAISQVPELKDLAGLTDQLYQDLWPLKDELYAEKDGEWNVKPKALLHLLTKEAKRMAEVKRLEKASKTNAAAVRRPVAPTIPTRGQAPGARANADKPDSGDWQAELMRESIED